MSLLMGPSPRSGNNNGIQPKVTRDTPRKVRSTGIAGKLERTFFEALDANSFDTRAFAHMVSKFPLPMQRRMLEIIVYFCQIHSERLDGGRAPYVSEEEYDLMVNAKRTYNALRPFHF